MNLQKAFNLLDHSNLLMKLEHYGFREIVKNLIASYLCNRKQYIFPNIVSSVAGDMSYGVPQGLILGTLIFLIYVNDVVNCSHLVKFILFVDDINALLSGKKL